MMPKPNAIIVGLFLFSASLLIPVGSYETASVSSLVRASTANDGSEANGSSLSPVISGDGHFVAFTSSATNLTSDPSSYIDVYLFDSITGTVERISLADNGTTGNGGSDNPSLSIDGRFIAFQSEASNLIGTGADSNGFTDIFVRDHSSSTTIRASIADTGAEANGASIEPSISQDGMIVAFTSSATNLLGIGGDTNGLLDVFIHDFGTGDTVRVSEEPGGSEADGLSRSPAISSDGRYVAFHSSATNLLGNGEDTNNSSDIFLYDRTLASIALVSSNLSGLPANGNSISAAISSDGRYIAFTSSASDLVPSDQNGKSDVFVRDTQLLTTVRVSVDSDGNEGNGISGGAVGEVAISADGRFVTFKSAASNLVPGDTNNKVDIFIHDLETGRTERVSLSAEGFEANNGSGSPVISAEGSYVAFISDATNLLGTDTYGWTDVFLRRTNFVTFLSTQPNSLSFSQAASGNVNGMGSGGVNSWFDHTSPNYSTNQDTTVWSGRRYTGSTETNVKTCTTGVACYDGHDGIDFRRNADDDQIYAAASGVVLDVISTCSLHGCEGLGNYVKIDHGNHYMTIYGHMSNVFVGLGDTITDPSSQPLGIVGSTGNSTGAHLHFGVYFDHNGDGIWNESEVVDPFGWFGQGDDPWSPFSRYLWTDATWNRSIIGISGGSLNSPSGSMSASFPPGALSDNTVVELWDDPVVSAASASLRSSGRSFSIHASVSGLSPDYALDSTSPGLIFQVPISLDVTYDPSYLNHIDIISLEINWWDEMNQQWVSLPTTLDLENGAAFTQTQNTGSFNLQGPLICPEDAVEPNDAYDAATTIASLNTPLANVFDVAGDQDWYSWDAHQGQWYSIRTSNLDGGSDTLLELYDVDGLTILASEENHGAGSASKLQWQAPFSGTYFVRILQAPGSNYGCESSYDFQIEEIKRLYLPFIVN